MYIHGHQGCCCTVSTIVHHFGKEEGGPKMQEVGIAQVKLVYFVQLGMARVAWVLMQSLLQTCKTVSCQWQAC